MGKDGAAGEPEKDVRGMWGGWSAVGKMSKGTWRGWSAGGSHCTG